MSYIKRSNEIFENDEDIKKYGHHYSEYENLKYFDFPANSSTKEFCEKLITLKIKLSFLTKVSTIVLVSWICSFILLSLLNVSFIKEKNNLLIISICFCVLSLIITCFSIWLFLKVFSLIKQILKFEEINKLNKLNRLNTISLVYLFTLFNFMCLSVFSFLYMYLLVKNSMNELSKNPSVLGIHKKDLSTITQGIKSKSSSFLA